MVHFLVMAYRVTEAGMARRERTRERIVEATTTVLRRGGWRAASVSAIAREAGLATGSVYRYFPSKSELFCEVFRRLAAREVDAVAAAESVAEGVEVFVHRALKARRLAFALLAEPVDPAVEAERLVFRSRFADVFATRVQRPDAELVGMALVGAIGEVVARADGRDEAELVRGLVQISEEIVGARHA